jgi:hypothetical protein
MSKKKKSIQKAVDLLQEHADSIKECHTYPIGSDNFTDSEAQKDYHEHLDIIKSLKKIID